MCMLTRTRVLTDVQYGHLSFPKGWVSQLLGVCLLLLLVRDRYVAAASAGLWLCPGAHGHPQYSSLCQAWTCHVQERSKPRLKSNQCWIKLEVVLRRAHGDETSRSIVRSTSQQNHHSMASCKFVCNDMNQLLRSYGVLWYSFLKHVSISHGFHSDCNRKHVHISRIPWHSDSGLPA
eukprot:2427323-Amphidinium_carterae.1